MRFRADRYRSQLARGGICVGVLPFYGSGFLDDLWRCSYELAPSRYRSSRRRDNCSMLRSMGSPSYTRREGFQGLYDPGSSRGYPDSRLYGLKEVAHCISWYMPPVLLVRINDPRRLLRVMTETQNIVTCWFATTSETCLKLDWVPLGGKFYSAPI
jgi:hypothetical protein